jgi:ABC-type branched-subunit amino acid transport system substrate-binding protein
MKSPISMVCAAAVFLAPLLHAESGVTDKEVRIGSCVALTGEASTALGIPYTQGAKAYFDYLNEKGGIAGRKINFIIRDDAYDSDKAILCYKDLMKEDVFLTGISAGSATCQKYAALAETNQIPFMGCSAGATFMYEPLKKYVFAVRASYIDETRGMVDHLWNDLALRKFAVIFQSDSFGASGLDGVTKALKTLGSVPVATASFPRQTLEIAEAYKILREANPEVVVIVALTPPAAAIMQKAHDDGWAPRFLVVAGRDIQLIKSAGAAAEGVVVANTTPTLDQKQLPTVALFNKVFPKYYPGVSAGNLSFQGFVDAMLMGEGLSRAGKNPTRDLFILSLESLHAFDIGLGEDFKVNLSATDHKAFEKLTFSVLRGGKPVPIKNWKADLKH